MFKRVIPALLCFSLLLLSGCGKEQPSLSVEKGDEPSSSVECEVVTPIIYINPLTGLSGISGEKIDDRPVAVMINNISIAQPAQTGINKADIIYETEVEGGITRLMAVFQDITAAEKVGPIRSARYPYVDLAMGHNAIYVHCGQDEIYCKPHLYDLDDVDLNGNKFGKYSTRIKNGLAREHTLYSYSQKLWSGFLSDGVKTERGSDDSWVNFSDENTPVTLATPAATVSIPFSTSYHTIFKYDTVTGRYSRYFKDTLRKDYYTGEVVTVKNVFVLLTSISDYPDGYHRKVALQSGDGYYCVNGTYTPIKWSKGAAKNGFTFTNPDGSPLTVNAGNSWVCIANTTTSTPSFQ